MSLVQPSTAWIKENRLEVHARSEEPGLRPDPRRQEKASRRTHFFVIGGRPNGTRAMNANLNGHNPVHLFDSSKSPPTRFFDDLRGPDMKPPETLSELVEDFEMTASVHHADIDVQVRVLTMTAKDSVIDNAPATF